MKEHNSEPRKHHYIPQSYLKGFQYGNKKTPQIVVYLKDKPSKSYISAIKDTACEKDFHLIKEEDGYDRSSVEELLSSIENETIQNIRKVIEKKQINDEEKFILAITILLMKTRVPQNMNALKKQFKSLLEEIAEENFKQNNDGLKGSFKDNYKITVHNNLPVLFMLKSLLNEKIISMILKMNFSLVKAPAETPFVCSDAPISYYCKNYKSKSGVGLNHKDLEIFLPLDKTFGLICTRKKISKYKELTKEEVNCLNRRTVITAEKYIFSPIREESINKLIDKNINEFSGIKCSEKRTANGLLQCSTYIPVTD